MTDTARALLLVLAVVLCALATDRLRARAHSDYAEHQTYEDTYYLPPNDWLSVFSLGWDEALADLIWMRALVYYGEEMRQDGAVQFVFRYGEAIEALDPEFVAVYRWVGVAGLYRPHAITVEDIEHTVRFMQRGAERHPNDGELIWDIGAILAYELPPVLADEEASDLARERALPFLTRAARLGAAPAWATLTNAAMLARVGRTDLAARHLEEMYDQADDPQTRSRIAARIRQLRTQAEAEAFLAAMEQLEQERRDSFPYVGPSLFLLLGERPVLDLDAPIHDGFPAVMAEEP